ncbi:hypothetical protein [Brevundimonas balnearis]|uniref:Uncharacterized protein n=1 Tax=Brevundimonas balnearis TaxID=1572858 RepID=A0ABV6R1R6_9CAUL
MIEAQDHSSLNETAEAVARQIVGVEHGAKRTIIWTPLAYPSGSLVGVRLTHDGSTYSITDMASAYEEARSVRASKSFGRHASHVAEGAGVGFIDRTFFLRGVRKEQLAGAIVALANCAHTAATLSVFKQAALDAREAEEKLFARLSRLFGKVEVHRPVVGVSGTEWDVDAVVNIGGQTALFEAVGVSKQSIYATVAKYHDIARLPQAPVRIAAVQNRRELGSMLGVLSQAATVIEEATPDETVVQFAKAA